MRSQTSSPLTLVSRALVAERLDLMEGIGEGIDDAVFIRIAGALVRKPRYSGPSQAGIARPLSSSRHAG
jgi:hypothetical protein